MKKIISLFRRNYEAGRLVYDEVVPGAEWVIAGEGEPTVKFDGTCCMGRDGKLFKRYDRKMIKRFYNKLKSDPLFQPDASHYKAKPKGWEAAQIKPDHCTGHWPSWVPVSPFAPEDKWHCEAWEKRLFLPSGTYELVGPKIQYNPYGLKTHQLWRHDIRISSNQYTFPRTFQGLKSWFEDHHMEGVVWHHPDGRMVKIKRSDFGLSWPDPLETVDVLSLFEAGEKKNT